MRPHIAVAYGLHLTKDCVSGKEALCACHAVEITILDTHIFNHYNPAKI
jgi:hypothetical protein